ncbi:alpha-tocopherol transfer protein-like [Folsomia candida]|uniref:Alpha-tocopherol transfer protein-like n=1 Tax=Folsomia candida TaxID=158441 RepID=A0A226ERQ6_FOLCA|nr:alpha-tocopherol transfer protein-like [Folsomia candida]OXA60292.1 Alpha-tocopherol transfer protein-like [Folsomia candida]
MKLSDKNLEESVVQLKELVRRDPMLDCPLDKEFLVKFIRARKYDVESAFQTLKRYYEIRTLYREDFADFYPTRLKATLNSGIFMVLKHRDPYGRKILLFKTDIWDVSKYTVNEVFLTSLLLGEEMILSPRTQENGTVMIHDLSHLGLSHARQFNMRQIKKFIAVLQGAFPAKFKTIHVINQPYIHNVLLAISQPFLSKKFLSRIILHGRNTSKMQEFMPPEILPTSVGGHLNENEAVDSDFMNRLFDKDDYYRDLLRYGYRG